jgi:hypothetical protein
MGIRTKNILLNSIGIILIVFSLIRFYFLYTEGIWFHIFWLCNHVPFIMGIAILFRNLFVLMGEFCLGFLGMLIWVIDYFYFLFFRVSFTGNGEFFSTGTYIIVAFVLHVLTLPLAFWAIFLIGKKEKRAFLESIAHFIVLIPIIIYFGADKNLNCFFSSCLDFMPTFRFYTFFLLLAYLLIFIIPINYLINLLLKNRDVNYTF